MAGSSIEGKDREMRDMADWLNLQTKKDFQKLMLDILDPLKPYYTEGKAGLGLGVTSTNYDEKAILLEGFSRPLWGLVPFWAGGGEADEWENIYRQGLIHGTDPDSPEYWGDFHAFDQRFVEMAAIAYGLVLTPERIWEPLTAVQKDNLAVWLYGINRYELPVCNWVLFAVMVNVALKKLGRPYDGEKLEKYLKGAESFYLGEGWYQDGDSGQKDYYISFAIHFYSLFYSEVMGKEDPVRCERYRERACEFAKQFIYWFDEDGEALPFGRSLTYRFSQVSFFSICLQAGIEPFPVEVMKGLIVRHLNYWMNQRIFDRDHVLTIGYAYPNLNMAERYNGPGSPYWAMKTFAFLTLSDEHPFWKVQPVAFPGLPEVCVMKYADMAVKRYPHHVTAYVPGVFSAFGHGQSPAKYGKFAYDTKFGFSVARSNYEIHEAAPDSMLAFGVDGYVYVRRICEESAVYDHADGQEGRKGLWPENSAACVGVYSRWSPLPGITVETTLVPTENGHRRRHRIQSDRVCEAYECGFCVAADLHDRPGQSIQGASSCAENLHMFCSVESSMGEGIIITPDPNTNLLYSKTLLPAVKYRIGKGEVVVDAEIKCGVK